MVFIEIPKFWLVFELQHQKPDFSQFGHKKTNILTLKNQSFDTFWHKYQNFDNFFYLKNQKITIFKWIINRAISFYRNTKILTIFWTATPKTRLFTVWTLKTNILTLKNQSFDTFWPKYQNFDNFFYLKNQKNKNFELYKPNFDLKNPKFW